MLIKCGTKARVGNNASGGFSTLRMDQLPEAIHALSKFVLGISNSVGQEQNSVTLLMQDLEIITKGLTTLVNMNQFMQRVKGLESNQTHGTDLNVFGSMS